MAHALRTNYPLIVKEVICFAVSSTEPHSGFRIAFNMFDTDGNQRVDKKEFLVVRILGGKKNV